MAGEVYKLSLILDWKDNASKGIAAALGQLKNLDKQAKQTIATMTKLQNTVNKGFSVKDNKLLDYIKKVNSEAAKAGKGIGGDYLPTGKRKKSVKPDKETDTDYVPSKAKDELDNLTAKVEKHRGAVQRLAGLNERFFQPAEQIKDTWKSQISGLSEYTDEAKKLYLAQAKFKLINLSPEDNTKAFESVSKAVREMGITTQTEGIQVLTDLHTALGSLDHAIEAFPLASKYRFSMKTLFGDKFSDSEIESQIQNAFKFLEMTGKVAKGREEMERSFNAMAQITNATGGRVTPAEMLLLARRGGTSIQNLTPEGMRNLSAPIQELGGSGAGTSMMSMYQALVGGVMKESSAAEFDRLGLVDRSKIEYGKGQKIKRLLPDANKLGDSFMENPLAAADMLRDAMKAKGIDTDDQKAVSKELSVLLQNRTAQRLMSILMNQRSQVVKEAGLAAGSKDIDQTFSSIPDELKDLAKYQNALINFKTEAGIPLIEVAGKLSQSLLPLAKFFGDNPTVAQWTIYAIGAGKALKLFSETASIISNSGLSSFFSKTESEVEAVSEHTTGLKKNFLSLKNIGQVLLLIGIADEAWNKIQELRKVIDDWQTTNKGLDKAGQGQKNAYEQLPADKRNPKDEARNVLSLLQQGNNEFEKALGSKSQGWTESLGRFFGAAFGKNTNFPLYSANVPANDPKDAIFRQHLAQYQKEAVPTIFTDALDRASKERVGAQFFENRAPILKNPDVMAAFRRNALSTPDISGEMKAHVEKMLEMAFPQSFAQSSIQLTQEQQALKQNTSDLNGLFSQTKTNVFDFGDATGKDIDPLRKLSDAANGSAAGLRFIEGQFENFKLPQIQLQQPAIIPNSFTPSGNGLRSNSPIKTLVNYRESNRRDAENRKANLARVNGILASNASRESRKESSTQPIQIHYSPTVHLSGDAKTAKADFQEMLNEHANHISRLVADNMENRRLRA